MEHAQAHAHTLAQQYLAAWNERDTPARRARVARLFTLNAEYLDPTMRGAGHDGIDAMIAGAQQHFPGHRFVLAGTPDAHHDLLGLQVPKVTMPVAPGRSVAILVEVAARNQLLRARGVHAARALVDALDQRLERVGAGTEDADDGDDIDGGGAA